MKRLLSVILSVVLLIGFVATYAIPVSAESALEPSEDMIALLKALEGFDKYPRWDYQQWTVGYGSTCPPEDLARYQADGITEEEAEALLIEQMAGFVKSVNNFNDKYSLNLTQSQYDALLLFTYNMGHAWMLREGSFRSAVINRSTGNDLLFPFGQWCHAGGEILTQLVRRRLMEYNMYTNGVYSRTVPENLCYVILDANGGDAETDVQCYDADLTDQIRVTPTREGYAFEGWYTAQTGGEKITVLNASVGTRTLYARWKSAETTDPTEPTEPVPPPESESPTEPEDPTMEPVTVKVTASNVNIRKGPGTNYGTNGQVNKGDIVTITEVRTGSGYTWGKFSGGWIALMYTNYDDVINPSEPEPPVTEPPETEPPVTEPEAPKGTMGTITGDQLRIRENAGTSYKTLGYLNKGDRVEILETKKVGSATWGRISKGWISMDYVKLDQAAEAPAEPPVTEPPAAEPENPSGGTTMGTVNTSSLRIRQGAGTSYNVVGFVYKGNRVEILETKTVNGDTWGRISKGWISLSYVDLDQPETAVVKTVNTSCLRVRSAAGTNNQVVGYLYRGAKVTILETKTVDGTVWGRTDQGWVCMDYLK